MKTALTIAGSDSGGGAGIQADLKTFAALEVYGMSTITAVTAQNSIEVRDVQAISVDMIRKQMEAVLEDFPVHAIKIGMLHSTEVVKTVAATLKNYHNIPIVVDPVMISKGGHPLLAEESVVTLVSDLFPITTVITPNIPEAEVFIGKTIQTEQDMKQACIALNKMGAQTILLKGGHLEGNPDDLFYNGTSFYWLRGERIHTKNVHGTGCTLSSAIAANIAKEDSIYDAIRKAKKYITGAIEQSLPLGKGHGPTHHLHPWYKHEEDSYVK